MGLSVNKFIYDGDDVFDLNFGLGFTSRSDVDCYVAGDVPFDVPFNWITDSQVEIDSSEVELGDELVFTRTVSKVNLPVDLLQPGNMTREAITVALRHIMYNLHEVLDGRVSVTDVDDLIFSTVENAVTSALSRFVTRAYLKRDIVIESDFGEADKTEAYTSGGVYCAASDVLVFVNTPPAVTTEYLLSNGSQVQFSVTIDSNGDEVSRSTTDVELSSGTITSSVTGGNYVHGADLALVIPAISVSEVDLEVQDVFLDYRPAFEAARTD